MVVLPDIAGAGLALMTTDWLAVDVTPFDVVAVTV